MFTQPRQWLIAGCLLGLSFLIGGAILWALLPTSITWHMDGLATAMSFSHDGQALAVAEAIPRGEFDVTSIISLRNVSDAKIIRTFIGAATRIYSLAVSRDGQVLVAGGTNTIWLWRVSDGMLLHSIPAFVSESQSVDVTQLVFSEDGQTFAAVTTDGALRSWHVSNGHLSRTLVDPEEDYHASAIVMRSDGMLVAGTKDEQAIIWHAEDRTVVMMVAPTNSLGGQSYGKSGLQFSADGKLIASVLGTTVLGLWRVDDGGQVAEMYGHTDQIQRLAFSPDGSTLASGSGLPRVFPSHPGDRLMRLWNTEDGMMMKAWRTPNGQIFDLVFSPDGHLLAVSSADGTIRLWQID